jgi:hypothetical protein
MCLDRDVADMDDEVADTDRTVVKTYVPAYQKQTWTEHADRLGMSQSEFIRTMVQAGRRDFELDPEEPGSDGSNPGGNALEDRVLAALRDRGALDWEELVDALTDDLEDRLEAAMDELQRDDLVRYSGRAGGYDLVEGSP